MAELRITGLRPGRGVVELDGVDISRWVAGFHLEHSCDQAPTIHLTFRGLKITVSDDTLALLLPGQ